MNYKKIALFFLLLFSSQEASSMQWISWIIRNPNKSITLVATAYYMYKTMKHIFFWCFANYLTEDIWLGTSLVHYAQKEYDKGKQDFLIYLAQHKYNQTFLCYAYDLYRKDKKNNKNPLFFFLDNGADPNIYYSNKTLLKRACIDNDTELVEKLLMNKAHPDDNHPTDKYFHCGCYPTGNDAWTYSGEITTKGSPLTIAFHKNFPEIIKLLIEHNATPAMINFNSRKKNVEPLNPSLSLECNDFISFNHLIDYHIRQENQTLNIRDTSLYKYWLIQQIAPQEHCGAFKNVVDKRIMPFYARLTIFKDFDQSLESLCKFYSFGFTKKEQNILKEKRAQTLQTRRDNANSFLPISMPIEEIL